MTSDPQNPLAPNRADQGEDGTVRKEHYGEGTQPWDIAVSRGWGAAFAASNVVKYLRRTKNPEHSLESARWYYARLTEGAAGESPDREKPSMHATPWSDAAASLELMLTKEEIALVRDQVAGRSEVPFA